MGWDDLFRCRVQISNVKLSASVQCGECSVGYEICKHTRIKSVPTINQYIGKPSVTHAFPSLPVRATTQRNLHNVCWYDTHLPMLHHPQRGCRGRLTGARRCGSTPPIACTDRNKADTRRDVCIARGLHTFHLPYCCETLRNRPADDPVATKANKTVKQRKREKHMLFGDIERVHSFGHCCQ